MGLSDYGQLLRPRRNSGLMIRCDLQARCARGREPLLELAKALMGMSRTVAIVTSVASSSASIWSFAIIDEISSFTSQMGRCQRRRTSTPLNARGRLHECRGVVRLGQAPYRCSHLGARQDAARTEPQGRVRLRLCARARLLEYLRA